MRKNTKNYNAGDFRVKRKFLWFPRNFGGDHRWLKFANIRERFMIIDYDPLLKEITCAWQEIGYADDN